MQECFRVHPDIYGAELEDDEDGIAEAPSGLLEQKSATSDEDKSASQSANLETVAAASADDAPAPPPAPKI
jgi:hypothetical protein